MCEKTCRDHPHWSLQVFQHYPVVFVNIYVSWNDLKKPFESIQNLMLMHKLIRIHSAFILTWKNRLSIRNSKACCKLSETSTKTLHMPNVVVCLQISLPRGLMVGQRTGVVFKVCKFLTLDLPLSGYRHTTISLICMSTHKATATRCLSYHQKKARPKCALHYPD